MTEVPPPSFTVGALVTVVPGGGRTVRTGTVERIVWHHKLQQHIYFLRVGERRISRRYTADELRPAAH